MNNNKKTNISTEKVDSPAKQIALSIGTYIYNK